MRDQNEVEAFKVENRKFDFASKDWIKKLIGCLVIAEQERLIYATKYALEKGIFDSELFLGEEIDRRFVKELVSLKLKGMTPENLKEHLRETPEYRTLVEDLCVPNNEDGRIMAEMLVEKTKTFLMETSIRDFAALIKLPKKDFNSRYMELLDGINHNMQFDISLEASCVSVKDIEKLKMMYQLDEKKGGRFYTGFPVLDSQFKTIRKGRVVSILANTHYGKTFFALSLASNWLRNERKGIYLSTESSTIDLHKAFMSKILDEDVMNLEDPKKYQNTLLIYENLISKASGELHIMDKISSKVTVEEIKRMVKDRERQHGKTDFLVCDQLYDLTTQTNKSEAQAWAVMGQVIQDLKEFADDNDLVIIVLNQMNRAPLREKREAGLGDVGYSLKSAEKADGVLILDRIDKKKDVAEVLVAKIKKGRFGGGKGETYFHVNFGTLSFKEISEDEAKVVLTELGSELIGEKMPKPDDNREIEENDCGI